MTAQPNLTPTGVVNSAADLIERTQRWLRTDQAAIMRQLPEQQSAAQWWFNQGREHADSVVTVPAWIEHFYGQHVVADPNHPTLTATAAAVAGLLAGLSDQLRQTPLYLVDDPDVRAALITLAITQTYRNPTNDWPSAYTTGTLLFAEPVPIEQHTAPDMPIPGLSGPVSRTTTPTLAGTTWHRESGLVRCVDWVHTGVDSLGVATIDDQIRQSIGGDLTPPMLNNGHWKLPTAGDTSQADARARLMAAHTEVMTGRTRRWDGDSDVVDADTLLAARLTTVIADALAADLFAITERRITTTRTSANRKPKPRKRNESRQHKHPARTVLFTVSPRPASTNNQMPRTSSTAT